MGAGSFLIFALTMIYFRKWIYPKNVLF